MAVNCRESLLPADIRWALAPEWDAAAREPHSQGRPDANLSIWSRFLAHRQILSRQLLKTTGF
jgi:hypothetical protein